LGGQPQGKEIGKWFLKRKIWGVLKIFLKARAQPFKGKVLKTFPKLKRIIEWKF